MANANPVADATDPTEPVTLPTAPVTLLTFHVAAAIDDPVEIDSPNDPTATYDARVAPQIAKASPVALATDPTDPVTLPVTVVTESMALAVLIETAVLTCAATHWSGAAVEVETSSP